MYLWHIQRLGKKRNLLLGWIRWWIRNILSSSPLMSTSKSQLTRLESMGKQKNNLMSKDTKKKSQQNGGGSGCAHDTIKFHTTWVGDPQLENNYITEFPLKEFWAPHQAPQPGGRAPEHLALKASRAWLQGLLRTGGKRDPTLRGHTQGLTCTRTQGKSGD